MYLLICPLFLGILWCSWLVLLVVCVMMFPLILYWSWISESFMYYALFHLISWFISHYHISPLLSFCCIVYLSLSYCMNFRVIQILHHRLRYLVFRVVVLISLSYLSCLHLFSFFFLLMQSSLVFVVVYGFFMRSDVLLLFMHSGVAFFPITGSPGNHIACLSLEVMAFS